MRWKRLFYYLLLNVIVTACTMVAVLFAWERYRPQVDESPLGLFFPTQATSTEILSPEAATTPVPLEDLEFEQYTVQAGDSLTAIADGFGISVEEILAHNPMNNPNALVVGTVLSIPVEGGTGLPPTALPTDPAAPPPTLMPAPTLESTGVPADAGSAQLEVVTVIGAGDLAEERVVIRQSGEAQVSLLGWQIVSGGGAVYAFPQIVLFKDGAVTVFTKAGANNVAELHWGLDAALWSSGDVVSLLDPSGNIIAAYQVP